MTKPTNHPAKSGRVPSAWRDRRVPWTIQYDTAFMAEFMVLAKEHPLVAHWARRVLETFALHGTVKEASFCRMSFGLRRYGRFKRQDWRIVVVPLPAAHKLRVVRIGLRHGPDEQTSVYFSLPSMPKLSHKAKKS